MTYEYDPYGKILYSTDDNEQYHSFNNEPAIIHLDDGTKVWMKHGKLDRDNGPAIHKQHNANFSCEYDFKNGKLDNKDRHAVRETYSHTNGCSGNNEYFVNGIKYDISIKDDGFKKTLINGKWTYEIWVNEQKVPFISLPVYIKGEEKFGPEMRRDLLFGYITTNCINPKSNDNSMIPYDITDEGYIKRGPIRIINRAFSNNIESPHVSGNNIYCHPDNFDDFVKKIQGLMELKEPIKIEY